MGDDVALKEEIKPDLIDEPIVTEEHDEIVLIGEEGEVEETTPAPPKRNAVRDMRSRIKEQNKENRDLNDTVRDLQKTVAQLTAGGVAPAVVESQVKVKPTLAEYSYDTDKYEAALDTWHDTNLDARLDKRQSVTARTSADESASRITEEAITGHYARASDLNVPDFEATEDAAINVLGANLVQAIQSTSGKSELILYYLGKKPEEAARIAALYQTSPGAATLALGELSSKIALRPRTSNAPNPDMGVKGGGGVQSQPASYNRHMKALQKAYASGDLQAAQDVRKEAKAAGVELPFNVAE